VDSYFRSAKYDRLFEKTGIVGIMPPINAKAGTGRKAGFGR
jgi:hypothetical protein